jgi:hypothetical protein
VGSESSLPAVSPRAVPSRRCAGTVRRRRCWLPGASPKNSVQQRSLSLFPTARCSRCCGPREVLDLDVGQIAGDEPLGVLPEPIGDVRDRGLRDQQLTGGVTKGILDVAGGQSAGVHLVDERLEHLAVTVEEARQAGPERLARAADLARRRR